jgi:hypothetical protein
LAQFIGAVPDSVETRDEPPQFVEQPFDVLRTVGIAGRVADPCDLVEVRTAGGL